MSKAVWTILVLVMASFTGCLDSTDDVEPEDEKKYSQTEQQSGGGDNDTEEDEILLNEIRNLTTKLEELRESVEALTSENDELQDAMTNLEFYQYDAPASSIVYIYDLTYDDTWADMYDGGENVTLLLNQGFSLEKRFRITKENNTITIEHVGPLYFWLKDKGMIPDSPSNCTNYGLSTSYLNADGSVIESYQSHRDYIEKGAVVATDCIVMPSGSQQSYWTEMNNGVGGEYFWSSMTIELPEEPERFTHAGTTYTFA